MSCQQISDELFELLVGNGFRDLGEKGEKLIQRYVGTLHAVAACGNSVSGSRISCV